MGRAAEAFAAHCDAWNTGDRGRWFTLFAADVSMEDPVGVAPKRGHGPLATTWDRSHTADRRWELRPRRIVECGNEVAVDLVNVGYLGDREVVVESIEIWAVDDDGLVASVRTFFSADPTVNDPWYVPTT